MNLEHAHELARRERLYPGLILHGGEREQRIEAATDLARRLLCEREAELRPCGECRHCRRIRAPGEEEAFHPDFRLVERDLRTATSVDAVKSLVRGAQLRPFEARGQVFVLADAHTLQDGAANALLKSLEEPATTAPRHYFLLTPSATELLPTLRSRCLSIYLGEDRSRARIEQQSELLDHLRETVESLLSSGSAVQLLVVARLLHQAARWDDLRSEEPWTQTAMVALEVARPLPRGPVRGAWLRLSEELLDTIDYRLRAVPALRILEGVVSRCLAPLAAGAGQPASIRR